MHYSLQRLLVIFPLLFLESININIIFALIFRIALLFTLLSLVADKLARPVIWRIRSGTKVFSIQSYTELGTCGICFILKKESTYFFKTITL